MDGHSPARRKLRPWGAEISGVAAERETTRCATRKLRFETENNHEIPHLFFSFLFSEFPNFQ